MPTITYIKIFVLFFVLILCCILGTIYQNHKLEHYISELDTLIHDKGLPLSYTETLNVKDNSYYKEIDGATISKVLSSMVNASSAGNVSAAINSISGSTSLWNLNQVTDRLLEVLNKEFNMSMGPKDAFKLISENIQKVEATTNNEQLVTSRHIVHRQSRMFGFVIIIQSLWSESYKSSNSPIQDLYIIKAEAVGILPEDALQMVKGCDTDEAANPFRPYGDAPSFIQSEAIMKPKDYEEAIIKEQVYGLSQDRGISSSSFK